MPPPPEVPFRAAVRVWVRVAVQSFGGPAGQIAVMHRILVEEQGWVDEEEFLHALSYCMLLPGPEAQQLATYVGWKLHGTRGGVVAGTLFVLPGFLAILALSFAYVLWRDVVVVEGLLLGLQAAVLAIVAQAVRRLGRRVLRTPATLAVAALAFAALFLGQVPFPLVVAAAAAAGAVLGRVAPAAIGVPAAHPGPAAEAGSEPPPPSRRERLRALRVPAVLALLWTVPVALLALALGREHVLVAEAVFFGKAAVVTFGGAYAVLAYVAQAAVAEHGWLEPGEMLDGLGMAETTPGPLIQVVQFVGFLGAYRHPGGMDPLVAGVLGSVVTTWVTFVPCFLWIFLGAPYVEALRRNRTLTAALSAVTAAVVGVVLNLAVWFALHALFAEVAEARVAGLRLLVPDPATVRVPALLLAVGALVATFRYRVGMLPLLAACAGLGAALRLLGAGG